MSWAIAALCVAGSVTLLAAGGCAAAPSSAQGKTAAVATTAPADSAQAAQNLGFVRASELRTLLAQLDRVRRQPPPAGPRRVLFAEQVAHVDGWIPVFPKGQEDTPPPGKPYYQATYVAGRLLEVTHVDDTGQAERRYRLWHNPQGAPILYEASAGGTVTALAWASYDPAGYLARVIFLSGLGQLRMVHVMQNTPGYQTTVVHSFDRSGAVLTRTLYEGGEVRSGAPGHESKVGEGTRLAWLTQMVGLGLEPVYPIPAAAGGPTTQPSTDPGKTAR